ncbi:MAG TPA: pyridoxal phosphate-dependent aminotransferase [Vicinamibacteria bacterium]|nr:pyridoxal phosphate-dependent aminotransferase [Vicinamibacteria bacterium]
MADHDPKPRPFLLERYFARFEFTARFLLASSDCEALSLAELLDLADDADRAAWAGLRLGYTESPGLLDLRQRIAASYPGLGPDDVVTAAPEEALYLLGRAALRSGDRVIVTFPGYQSLYEIASAVGARVERWTPEERENGWWFDPGRLEALARGGARAIVVNFPHNPTGALPDAEEWSAVVAAAERAGAILVSDEMYRGLEYDPLARLTPGALATVRGVSVGGLSKAYGLPGLRTGWLATRDRALLEAVQAYKDYTTICASAPGERLAVVALKNAERLRERCRAIVAANRPVLEAFLGREPETFAWRPPRAGPIAFVRLRPGAASSLCERLAEAAGVMLVPGRVFEWGENHVRFGFGRVNFPEALAALEEHLRSS